MPSFGYESDDCGAAPGVCGWLACNKSCCNEQEDTSPIEVYNEPYVPIYKSRKQEFSKLKYTEIKTKTKKALLFNTKKYGLIWVPISQIKGGNTKEGYILIPKWLKNDIKKKKT